MEWRQPGGSSDSSHENADEKCVPFHSFALSLSYGRGAPTGNGSWLQQAKEGPCNIQVRHV